MIVDKIENISNYLPLLSGLDAVDKFVNDFAAKPLPSGRYDLDGDRVFANVQSYTTKPLEGAQFEAHKKYVDLQAVMSGVESIFWAPVDTLTQESESFSSGGDIAFYSGDAVQNIVLRAGYFVLLFPDDAHMPCIECAGESQSTKIVVKLAL